MKTDASRDSRLQYEGKQPKNLLHHTVQAVMRQNSKGLRYFPQCTASHPSVGRY